METLYNILIIIMLFLLSAFFSGSETALTSLSRYRLKKIAVLEKSLKAVLSKWLVYPQQILATILVGNTIVNILISTMATLTVVSAFSGIFRREVLEVGTWLVITFLILLFGEIVPKIHARNNPEQVTLNSSRFLGMLSKIIYPLIRPVLALMDRFVPNLGFIPMGRITSLSIEEIKSIVMDSSSRGLLYQETGKMLEGVLKLGQMKVSEIMVPANKVDSVDIEQDARKAVEKIVETGRSRVPVYAKDRARIRGIVLMKDLLSKTNLFSQGGKIEGFPKDIIRPAYFIQRDKKASELLYELQRGISNCAVVVDGNGGMRGFVTIEDILEEIVGEILDEYDVLKARHG